MTGQTASIGLSRVPWQEGLIGSEDTKLNHSKEQKPLREKIIQFATPILGLSLLGLGYTSVSTVRYGSNALNKLKGFPNHPIFLSHGKALAAITIPGSVRGVYNSVTNLFKGTISERVDSFLNATADTGFIGDAVSTFATGLESLGLVAGKTIFWATPLLVGSLVLEAASVVFGLKGIGETISLQREFSHEAGLDKKTEKYTVDDYQRGINYLEKRRVKEYSFDGKYFNLDGEKFADRLIDIELEAKLRIACGDIKGAQELMHDTVKTVNRTIKARVLSFGALTTLSTAALIGVSTLLAASPAFAVVGFSLLTFAVSTSLIKCAFDLAMKYKAENELKFDLVNPSPEFPAFPSKVKS